MEVKETRKAIHRNKEHSEMSFVAVVGFILLIIFYLAATSYGQTGNAFAEPTAVQGDAELCECSEQEQTAFQPVFTGYRGIMLGMTADEVRRLLNKKPKYDDTDGFYYIFSDKESAQFVLDENKRVKMVSVIYSRGNADAPSYEDVFGSEIQLEIDADGRINKLINYPDAGFWIAYYQAGGENPKRTLTVQKLMKVEDRRR